ncbi:MAG: hypothetical protein FWH04_01875 [Oscillospiraceae bacterium]|nr:hypothetical protein [Oscillospiraceae bacterium]
MKIKSLGPLALAAVLLLALLPSVPGMAYEGFAWSNALNSSLVGSPTVIARASSPASINTVIRGGIASSVMIDLSSMSDVPGILDQTRGNIIPIFVLQNRTLALQLADYFEENEVKDTHIASTDASLIQAFRKISIFSRASLIHNAKSITLANAYNLVRKANECQAKNVIINVSAAGKAIVEAMQKLTLTVWVVSDDKVAGNHRSITSGATGIVTGNATMLRDASRLYTTKTLIRRPFITGHRGVPGGSGFSFISPENTMSSFYMAHEEFGADIIECDVFLTKDNQAVVLHDSTFARTTDVLTNQLLTDEEIEETGRTRATVRPRDLTLEQIKRLDAGMGALEFMGEKIPALEEVLSYVKANDLVIFLESKDSRDGIEQAVVDSIASHGDEMWNSVVIISFITESLERYRELSPWASLVNLNTLANPADTASAMNDILNVVLPLNAAYGPTTGAINQALASESIARGVPLSAWTFRSESTQRRYIDFGITGITTDFADWTAEAVMSITAGRTEYSVNAGKSIKVSAATLTNRGADARLPVEVVVLSGGNRIQAKKDSIKGLRGGKAVIMLKAQSKATRGCNSYTLYSQPVTVNVAQAAKTSKPKITKQPKKKHTVKRNKRLTLKIKSAKPNLGKLSYQWYSSKKKTGKFKAVKKAKTASYKPPTTKKGTLYYYCMVTNTDKHAVNKKATRKSRVFRIKVK